MEKKHELRRRRHHRLRRRVTGTPQRPRLAVFRSLKHIYAQIIDDAQGQTLAAASTMDGELKGRLKTGGDIDAAKAVGKLIAERGQGNGHVGAAIGKARGIPDAIRKGFEAAKKELIAVPLAGVTIPHAIQSHHGASIVLLKPAAPGTGVVAGGSMRHILEAAGVKDVIGKSLGSANAINTAWATLRALSELRSPGEVARLRGVEASDLTYRRDGNAGVPGMGR